MDEIIDFLAASPSAQEIIAYQPPVVLQQRLHELLEWNRDRQLSEEEQAELEDFYRLDRFMSRLKLRVRDYLTEKDSRQSRASSLCCGARAELLRVLLTEAAARDSRHHAHHARIAGADGVRSRGSAG